ncbi:cyclic nucleotide-binding domain-containing protein [Paenibacillus sp. alder61]|uniref:Cyclic nucleotide-binding domain-containing protein n=1 Tax=Paenibacillus faecis TaxID=862114 RepID=A0A5D0CJK2_9BACL|nr:MULTISPECIES: cyclic nucleotide-binding domain-containing protein [Paenibacillus]MCA1295566.1 cyclic nucleotide-binding domain-containing protein [Paenibacillus sp. alder61]TYA10011.1 cyclic nucleotide-binding domain-containing protein [Paenibacillus faecis]
MKEIKDPILLETYLREYGLEPVLYEKIRPYCALYEYNRGDLICSQGESPEILYILVKGKLKVFTTNAEGKTLVISFKTALELVGDIEYVQETDILNTVEAVTGVHMIAVPYRILRRYGQEHAPLLQFLLKVITRKFYLKSNSISLNMMYPVDVRLASYLVAAFSDESHNPVSGLLSTAELKDVANLIGVSYRHLNRIILQFCSNGLLERKKGGLLVKNLDGLGKMAIRNIYEYQ